MPLSLLNTFGVPLESRNANTREWLNRTTNGLMVQNRINEVENGLRADLQRIFNQVGTNIPDQVLSQAHLMAESSGGTLSNVQEHYKNLTTVAKARLAAAEAELNHQMEGIKIGMKLEELAHKRAQTMLGLGNSYHKTQISTMGKAIPSGGRGAQRHRQLMATSFM